MLTLLSEELGIDRVVEMALDAAWKDADAVYLSYDIDSIEAAFVPGTGWPEPGGLLPRASTHAPPAFACDFFEEKEKETEKSREIPAFLWISFPF